MIPSYLIDKALLKHIFYNTTNLLLIKENSFTFA